MNLKLLIKQLVLTCLAVIVSKNGVKKLRVRVTQCPPSIQTNRMSRNKEHDLDHIYNAFFQIKVFSRFHYVLLCNLYLVYGSGNGHIHDYITRHNKTERKLLLETAQCISTELNRHPGHFFTRTLQYMTPGISWFRCNTDFFLKQNKTKQNNRISFRLVEKKNIEILAPKPSLNGLSINGDQNFLHQRWSKK